MTYVGTVMSMQEGVDNFPKSAANGGGTMWCHSINIALQAFNGDVAICQMCVEQAKVTQFEINDEIKFQVNKFTKDVYSIKFVERLAKKAVRQQSSAPERSGSNMWTDTQGRVRNPVVSGTAIERASANAAHVLQMQGNVDLDKFIAFTKGLYNLYMEYSPE